MQNPNFHTTPNWILSHLPFISCALPLPAEWHGNSSHIHALLLTISIGTVLLRCLRTKAGMQGILEGVRWYPSVGLLLIFLAQGLPVASGRWSSEVFGHAWQGMFDNPAGLACFACCLLVIESVNRTKVQVNHNLFSANDASSLRGNLFKIIHLQNGVDS